MRRDDDRVLLDSHRSFQLWSATVSHSQLLFRSTRSDDHETRVEVLLKSVLAMKVLNTMRGLTIREANEDEVVNVLDECVMNELSPEFRVFSVFDMHGFEGWIIAGVATTVEDDGAYNDPSSLM